MSHRLTKADIQALRKSDYAICFYHRAGTRGEGWVRAISNAKGDDRVDRGLEHEIPVDSAITSYEHRYSDEPVAEDQLDAYHMVHHPMSGLWQSLAGLLRVGDELRLHWYRGNNSKNVEAVGYNVDELRLLIRRGRGRELEFRLAFSVGPPNTARMTRSIWERMGYTPEQIADVRALRALGSQGE